ncbi:MAG: hypothetical protein ACLFPJ_05040 [Candidatus Woesearchaeota archaeon]
MSKENQNSKKIDNNNSKKDNNQNVDKKELKKLKENGNLLFKIIGLCFAILAILTPAIFNLHFLKKFIDPQSKIYNLFIYIPLPFLYAVLIAYTLIIILLIVLNIYLQTNIKKEKIKLFNNIFFIVPKFLIYIIYFIIYIVINIALSVVFLFLNLEKFEILIPFLSLFFTFISYIILLFRNFFIFLNKKDFKNNYDYYYTILFIILFLCFAYLSFYLTINLISNLSITYDKDFYSIGDDVNLIIEPKRVFIEEITSIKLNDDLDLLVINNISNTKEPFLISIPSKYINTTNPLPNITIDYKIDYLIKRTKSEIFYLNFKSS